MARVKVKKKEIAEYQLTLTQEEFDLVAGIISDLGDEHLFSGRTAAMFYDEYGEKELARPRKKARRVLAAIVAAMGEHPSPDHDYYDWWKSEPLDSATKD